MTSKPNKKRASFWARVMPGSSAGAKDGRSRTARAGTRAWVKPALLCGAGLCALLAVGGTGTWLVQSGTLARWQTDMETRVVDGMRDAGLSLSAVYVAGRKQTDRDTIIATIGADVGDPILSIDPTAIRTRLENLGWVSAAQVERRLPGTLILKIEERTAAAIWQRDGDFVLIDRSGAIIGPEDVAKHRHLKIVVGEGAPANADSLLSVLDQEPGLKARVIAAVWLGERRWNLRLDNGVDVRLPEDDPQTAWKRLARLERDHDVLNRAVEAIDLRQPDRLIVRMTRDGALQIKARREGEET